MATKCIAFRDMSGKHHADPTSATLADLAIALSDLGAASGMTTALARLVLNRRADIELIFAEHYAMTARAPTDQGE